MWVVIDRCEVRYGFNTWSAAESFASYWGIPLACIIREANT